MDLYSLSLRLRSHWWSRLLTGLFFTLLGLGTRLLVSRWLDGFPFITFFVAIFFAAFLGGRPAGVTTLLVSAALALNFFIVPDNARGSLLASSAVATTVFLLAGGLVVYLMDRVQRTLDEKNQAQASLREANALLDARRRTNRRSRSCNA